MVLSNKLLIWLILFLGLINQDLNGQISKRDIKGNWVTDNEDSLYYKSDTISFEKKLDLFNPIDSDETLEWSIKNREFQIYSRHKEGVTSGFILKEKIKLEQTDFGQILILKRDKEVIDEFKILNLKNYTITHSNGLRKSLELLRFDKLEHQKLFNYVRDLVLQIPGYDSNRIDQKTFAEHHGFAKNAIIRHEGPPEGVLLVINGVPFEDRSILKKFLLVEAKQVVVIAGIRSAQRFGIAARLATIHVSVSEGKFKKVMDSWSRD